MRLSRIGAIVGCLAVLVACGPGQAPGGAGSSPGGAGTTGAGMTGASPRGTSPSPDGTSSPAEPSGTALPVPTNTKDVEVEGDPGEPVLVKAVRFADHGPLDRVVIDLDGDVTGYSVRWVDELIQDGSGEPIDVRGGAYLQVTLKPANAHTDEGKPTWTGGPIFQAGLGNVQNVVKTGDFEGVVGIGLVLDHRAPFSVAKLTSPDRLVVDVAH
ncbi:AMIN-like domain-containing (lipo)protein [Nonomuraea africana]|uniref:AMIN-like domain-containing (lipo)protein n=1 Tax=Nonomuraea africana TaxID=46171 RepID=UPI0033DDC945